MKTWEILLLNLQLNFVVFYQIYLSQKGKIIFRDDINNIFISRTFWNQGEKNLSIEIGVKIHFLWSIMKCFYHLRNKNDWEIYAYKKEKNLIFCLCNFEMHNNSLWLNVLFFKKINFKYCFSIKMDCFQNYL